MATPVYVFNTATESVSVAINQGEPFNVPGANRISWAPGTPSKNPSFVGVPLPIEGQFGYGENVVKVTPADEGNGPTALVNIPLDTSLARPLQLYLFSSDEGRLGWLLLEGGRRLLDSAEFMLGSATMSL